MRKYRETLDELGIKPSKIEIKGKSIIITHNDLKAVIKEKNFNHKIFEYLDSRGFNYYPKILLEKNNYVIEEYVKDIYVPNEQKILDLIDLVSLLHLKTTHHKEIDLEDYKQLFETISNNIEYLKEYYLDMITLIETNEFMSPSQYLFARNISKVLASLNFCKNELDKWYLMVKEKRKQRVVVLHNNLDLTHFIINEKNYLINWEKSKIDNPIFDIYKLYKKVSLDLSFNEIFDRYESNYKLLEDEKK
ncbi:MAG: hypothetical protein R3Y21_05025, partial [Mycoplasmatota bacterium]